MHAKGSGIGWLLVFGMAIMGLSAMPDDPPATPDKASTTQRPARPKPKPTSQPPDMTCDGVDCWWTDLGRPNR